MGVPTINITFKQKATTAINRSGRGVLLIILNDATKEQMVTSYTGISKVNTADWTEKNLMYLKLVFLSSVSNVIAVRGVVKEEALQLADTLQAVKSLNPDWLVYPGATAEDAAIMKDFVKEQRAAKKKLKAVVANYTADYEAIVNFCTDNISILYDADSEVQEFTASEYTVRIAALLAATSLTSSSTFALLPEIVDCSVPADADTDVDAGKLVIIYDDDDYKIARGVTSLTTLNESTVKDFQKIKILEGADLIQYDIYSTFKTDYVGKFNNTYDNKQMFVGAVNQYLKDLEGTVVNPDEEHTIALDVDAIEKYLADNGKKTEGLTEEQLKRSDTGSHILAAGRLRILDATEDLELPFTM